MKLDQLEKGFWGYKKSSVYTYITMAEEEFSAKLSEKDNQYKKNEEQYRARIAELEEELYTLKEQMDKQKNEKIEIASTLIAATQYGEILRREASEKVQKEQEKWERDLAEMVSELDRYRTQVAKIREALRALLLGMDEQSEELEQQMEAVQSDCPTHNMTLFARKKE